MKLPRMKHLQVGLVVSTFSFFSLIGVVIYQHKSDSMQSSIESRAALQSETILRNLQQHIQPELINCCEDEVERKIQQSIREHQILDISIVDNHAQIIASSSPDLKGQHVNDVIDHQFSKINGNLHSPLKSAVYTRADGRQIRSIYPLSVTPLADSPAESPSHFVLISYDIGAPKDSIFRNIIVGEFYIWLGLLLLVAVSVMVIHATFITPYEKIKQLVHSVLQGDYAYRIKTSRKDIFYRLYTVLNIMMRAVQKKASDDKRKLHDLTLALDSLPGSIYLKNPASEYLLCNRQFARELNIDASKIYLKTDYDLYPSVQARQLRDHDLRIVQSNQDSEFTNEFRSGGQVKFIRSTKKPVSDQAGRTVAILGTLHKTIKSPSRNVSYQTLKSLLNEAQSIARLGVWEKDLNSGKTLWSPQAIQILGLDEQRENRVESLISRIHPDDRESVLQHFGESLIADTRHDTHYRVIDDNGDTRWIFSRSCFHSDEHGKPQRIVVIVQDITEQKEAQDMLNLAATAMDTQEGIMISNSKGVIVKTNKSFSRITGYAADDVLGKSPVLLKSSRYNSQFYQQMWSSLAQTGRWEGEVWNTRKNGESYLQYETITAVRDSENQLSHYVAIFFDLTDLRKQKLLLERTTAEEKVFGGLLMLSLEDTDLDSFLIRSLELLLQSMPWLKLTPHAGIYLNESKNGSQLLELAANHNLPEYLTRREYANTCQQCLCGQSIRSRSSQFCALVDESIEHQQTDSNPLGHFCIALNSHEDLLGILILYHSDKVELLISEQAFLQRVADVLTAGIIRRRAEMEKEYQALHDALTGLPNRRVLLDTLKHDINLNRRRKVYGALLFLDLDQFKKVNDAIGHSTGDALLQKVAARLLQQVRSEDTVIRLGGDEFVILLSQLEEDAESSSYEAHLVAEKVRKAVSQPYYIENREHQITPSIGIVLFPGDNDTAETLLRNADNAMYKAKEAGRNAIRFYKPHMQDVAEKRLRMEYNLRNAIKRQELKLFLQPQVDASGKTIGAEALLRWVHSKKGIIPPADFIPLAEETGLIIPIGKWVITEACSIIRHLQHFPQSRHLQQISVNVSPRQFRDPEFVQFVEHALSHSGIQPQMLELELTEGILLDDIDDTVDKMQALKALGVSFSIDDFGTGYSSLLYLKKLPLAKLKIDRSFVQDVIQDPNDAAIVETIISMARHLNLEVIAEGVETREQFDFLNQAGCGAHQGFYFSRAVALDDFIQYLEQRRFERDGQTQQHAGEKT